MFIRLDRTVLVAVNALMNEGHIPKGIDDAVKQFCESLGKVDPPIPAKLFLDGQLVATGVVTLEEGQPSSFAPTDGSNLDKLPKLGVTLRVSGKDGELLLKDFHRCPLGSPHYHFVIVES